MYFSSSFLLAALPFLALLVDAAPSPVHIPALGPNRAPTPPMPNPDNHNGQTYVSQQWTDQNNKKPASEQSKGKQDMQQALPIVQDWQKHNNINQPGGSKQEDHVIKTGLHPSNDPNGEKRPHVTVQRQKPSGPNGPQTNNPKKNSVTTHIYPDPSNPRKHDPSPYGTNENPQTKTQKPHNTPKPAKPAPPPVPPSSSKPKTKPTVPPKPASLSASKTKTKPDVPAKPASLSAPKTKPAVPSKPVSLSAPKKKKGKRTEALVAEYVSLLRREAYLAKRDAYLDSLFEIYV